MKYFTVINDNEWGIDAAVQILLDNGWKLQGGCNVCFDTQTNQIIFVQAMVKEDDSNA